MIKAHVLSSKKRRVHGDLSQIHSSVEAWLLSRQNMPHTPIVTPYVSKHKTVTAHEASADNQDDTHDILRHDMKNISGNHARGIHRLSSKLEEIKE